VLRNKHQKLIKKIYNFKLFLTGRIFIRPVI